MRLPWPAARTTTLEGHATKRAGFPCPHVLRLYKESSRDSSGAAQLADGGDLRGGLGELGLRLGDFHRAGAVGERFLGEALGLHRLGLVEVVGAHRSVGEHRDAVGLHFHHAAGDVDHLFLAAVGGLDADGARLDAREQRHVLGQDAELAASPGAMTMVASPEKIACSALTMSTWKVLAMVSSAYCSVFAFSNASSIVPTM